MNKLDVLKIQLETLKLQKEVLLEMFKKYKEGSEPDPLGQICTGIQITALAKVIEKLEQDLIQQLEMELSSRESKKAHRAFIG